MGRSVFYMSWEILSDTTMDRVAPWAVGDQKVRTRIQKLKMALDFLCQFNDCVRVWEWDDEQTRIRVKMLWVKFFNSSVIDRMSDTWPVDAQAFYSLAFEMQGVILQIKLLVEPWCEYHLVRSSSMQMQPKNPDSPPPTMSSFINRFRNIIRILSTYRAPKMVPFKKQIDILIDKIRIMEKVMTNPVAAYFTDSKTHVRLKKFIAAFHIKATSLAILCWAKQETATEAEMSILLFNALHELIPYAPDVIVLISQNLLHFSSDSILLWATVASLVDFFFQHLVDDHSFLILRDPLIRIFTFLTHHNASPEDDEEEDVLRSQAYALFRDHSYLLQRHGDMKEKIHLSDFMSQIEITNAKITQLHYGGGFSDSCVSSEAEKLGYMYFVSISRELYLLEERVYQKKKESIPLIQDGA